MEDIINTPTQTDFSDIPALGDTKGLENFLNAETLKATGLPVQPTQPEQPVQSTEVTQPANPATPSNPTVADGKIILTPEQLNAILASRGQIPQQRIPAAQPQAQPRQQVAYTQQEQQFITRALAKGYSLDQINAFLVKQRDAQPGTDPMTSQRLAQIEQYLKDQEYKTAETAFINKLADFGGKWGLSEQDLIMFGNEALKHGINIAMENVDLEMVFRAVYPEQYAIRSRRMTPTSSSQIYGGTSIPESNRATTSKVEDAYVESFLKGAMPNQYAALNKK